MWRPSISLTCKFTSWVWIVCPLLKRKERKSSCNGQTLTMERSRKRQGKCSSWGSNRSTAANKKEKENVHLVRLFFFILWTDRTFSSFLQRLASSWSGFKPAWFSLFFFLYDPLIFSFSFIIEWADQEKERREKSQANPVNIFLIKIKFSSIFSSLI